MGLLGLFQVNIAQNFIERVESVEIFPIMKNKIVV